MHGPNLLSGVPVCADGCPVEGALLYSPAPILPAALPAAVWGSLAVVPPALGAQSASRAPGQLGVSWEKVLSFLAWGQEWSLDLPRTPSGSR